MTQKNKAMQNMERILNFSAGPSALPLEVLERAKEEMLSFNGIGASVMEISHRSKTFLQVLEKAKGGIREIMNVPDDYEVLFLSGGASLQFAMVPMNFLRKKAYYVVTGAWSLKAMKEAEKIKESHCGNSKPEVLKAYSSEPDFSVIPLPTEIQFDEGCDYVHYCSNETIDGVEFDYDLNADKTPVVCDASSCIMSKRIDVSKYSMIYAGAQKNLGPSGITVVIVKKEFLELCNPKLPTLLSYRSFAENNSMPNTPNTWGIYLIGLVCDWIREKGGLEVIGRINAEKARLIYEEIDRSDGFYRGRAKPEARSRMNVTFTLPSKELEEKFCTEAKKLGMDGLKGHRSVGGIRVSLYNAITLEAVARLVEFMRDFRVKNHKP
ncbi:MAG: phosphoserine aminotransferase [Pyrinomonadaceae bacterium]|jgi:phosphoserine aminotransferase|nr:MAG: phosphoserine aminotransferase [Pyrinomonadaceae bacterium]